MLIKKLKEAADFSDTEKELAVYILLCLRLLENAQCVY